MTGRAPARSRRSATLRRDAPSAKRSPISPVRRTDAFHSSAKSPAPVSSIALEQNAAIRTP